MNATLTDTVSYDCPSCHAALVAPAGDVGLWVRCPRCQRPSDLTLAIAGPMLRPIPPPLEDAYFRPEPPVRPLVDPGSVEPSPPETREPSPPTVPGPTPAALVFEPAPEPHPAADDLFDTPQPNYARVIFASGLFASVTLLLFCYLDRSVVGTSVFGTLAVICLILLVLPSRSRDADDDAGGL